MVMMIIDDDYETVDGDELILKYLIFTGFVQDISSFTRHTGIRVVQLNYKKKTS
jgi:hypothetical protein